MIVSRTERAVAAALVAVGLSVASAQAQQDAPGQPLRLAPRLLYPDGTSPSAPSQPERALPEAARQPPAMGLPSSSGDASVQVDKLATIDPDSGGTLAPENGGLPGTLWQGTDWEPVRSLVEALPVETPSPVMRGLMRRLLLTQAVPPGGNRQPGEFATLRARQLIAMGEVNAANDLLATIPGRDVNEALAMTETDARFLLNDNARACTLAGAMIGNSTAEYWLKAFTFCQQLSGEKAKAAVGLDLLREMGSTDKAFFSLANDVAAGKPGKLASLADPSPLHLAMARVAKDELPKDSLKTRSPAILRAIATNPYAGVDTRLEASERAEAAGAIPVDALRQAYAGAPFTNDELANPLTKSESKGGAQARALLYRASMVQTIPTAKAEAAARALESGRRDGRYASTVRAFLSILAEIPPSDELAWFAPEATRAFVVGGDPERARNWLRPLRSASLFRDEAKADLARLMPLIHLTGMDSAELPWTATSLTEWWEASKAKDGARGRAALLYTILESLGDSVPASSWTALLSGAGRTTMSRPDPVLWDRLEAATEEKRVGETVLLALVCLGDGGTAEVNPVVMRRVLAGLNVAGLTKESRELAVEAAATAGI